MRVKGLQGGYRAFTAEEVSGALSVGAKEESVSIAGSFERLVQDRQMGDGGRYRFRRFSRFWAKVENAEVDLEHLQGSSILQSVEDNPLNGGVKRTFEPLEAEISSSLLLRELIAHDIRVIQAVDSRLFEEPVVVGVHQVRIVALPESLGRPTPEGVHRDAEAYTFQHFWHRDGIQGGEFSAYDENKNQVFRWLQTERLYSVLFTGTTWHSASPISCLGDRERGYRDIFLIDFNPGNSISR